jgi:hypothetical protein
MGARASRPAAKLSPEEDRILFQGQLANKAARNYKAGWWATANQTKKANKNAARAKLSQLQLREKQRELKDQLAEAKVDLDNAKSDFQEAKKTAAKSGAGQNNRNARNDAEDEVDELEDKIHDIEKELRSIRKAIIYKAKIYKAFKPVKVAAGATAKAVLVNAPRMVVAGARILGAATFTAAVAAYNAGSKAYRAARKELMAAHYRGIIGMLEHDLSAGRNTATGKNLSNNDKSSKRNQLDAAKAALKNIMDGDSISAAQERAGKLAEKVEREIQSGIRKIPTYGRNGKLVTSTGPKKGVTFKNAQNNANNLLTMPVKGNNNNLLTMPGKGNNNNFGPFQAASPPLVRAANYVAQAAANPTNAAASEKAVRALGAAETAVKEENPKVAAAVAVQANAAANALKKQGNIFNGLNVKNRYQAPEFKPSSSFNISKKTSVVNLNAMMNKRGGRRTRRR